MATSLASLQRCLAAASRASSRRAVHTGRVLRAEGKDVHHHHADDPNAYLHAERMYDIPAMKYRKLKFGLGISAVVFGGIGITAFAVGHAQGKLMTN